MSARSRPSLSHDDAPGPAGPTGSIARVLVVEDEQDVAQLLRYNLANQRYDVVIVRTGAALHGSRRTCISASVPP